MARKKKGKKKGGGGQSTAQRRQRQQQDQKTDAEKADEAAAAGATTATATLAEGQAGATDGPVADAAPKITTPTAAESSAAVDEADDVTVQTGNGSKSSRSDDAAAEAPAVPVTISEDGGAKTAEKKGFASEPAAEGEETAVEKPVAKEDPAPSTNESGAASGVEKVTTKKESSPPIDDAVAAGTSGDDGADSGYEGEKTDVGAVKESALASNDAAVVEPMQIDKASEKIVDNPIAMVVGEVGGTGALPSTVHVSPLLTEEEIVRRSRDASPVRPSSSTFASRSTLRESFFSGSNASRSGTDDELDPPFGSSSDGGGVFKAPDLSTVPSVDESGVDTPTAVMSGEEGPVLFEGPSETSSAMSGEGATTLPKVPHDDSSLTDVPKLLSEAKRRAAAEKGDSRRVSFSNGTTDDPVLNASSASLASPVISAECTTAEALEAAEIRAAAVQLDGSPRTVGVNRASAKAAAAAAAAASSSVATGGAGVGAEAGSPPPKPMRLPSFDATKETSDDTHVTLPPLTPPSGLDAPAAIPADFLREETAAASNMASTAAVAGVEAEAGGSVSVSGGGAEILVPTKEEDGPKTPVTAPAQRVVFSNLTQKSLSSSDIPAPPPLTGDAPRVRSVSHPPPVEPVEREDHRIRLGICAMDKKARSKPMGEILSRLDETLFEVVFFGDDFILNHPVEDWPIVDILIAFYSSGYPLEKAEGYADLRRPFLLNDLPMQRVLKDRRRVYDLLEASGIDVPRNVYMSRDGYVSKGSGAGNGCNQDELEEHDDYIEINGVAIHKPFVEKPVDADDHNIAIYYPTSAGGGCKKLFRKVGDRSSEFYPEINEVRRDGSYIYEEFVETQGTDVKMYTVGPDYGHAEARKSPTVDGKVERNSDGKEVRFPVILTLREKEIARRIVLVFRQQVCGFDLLRVQEGDSVVSYVCDVNGWSFVKNSRKYYDDCAQILTEHMLAAVKPMALRGFSALDPMMTTQRDDDEYEYFDEPGSASTQSARGVAGEMIMTPKKRKKRRKPHHRSTGSSALQRVSRMLQGVGGSEETGGDGRAAAPAKDPLGALPSPVVIEPGASAAAAAAAPLGASLVVETAAATLEEGALPVRNIPHQLATNPPSMTASASSSVAGPSDDASFGTVGTAGSDLGLGRFKVTPTGEASGASADGKPRGSQGFHQEELRCVIAIIRHGDRTPKQKIKVFMSEPGILKYFHEHVGNCRKDLKVKDKKPMEAFLQTVKRMIEEKERERDELTKLEVVQEGGGGAAATAGATDPDGDEPKKTTRRSKLSAEDRDTLYKLHHLRDVLQRWKIGGLNRKLQIKPRAWEEAVINAETGETSLRCTEVQLILKWGGNLTKLGEKQSIHLGRSMRYDLYPDSPGGGILRLHSTFRHDLKIKTSDEGRVMKTAAAFAKGLLELEGEIPPILVSLVHKEKNSNQMLDPSGNKEVKRELEVCKEKINANLQRDFDFDKTNVEQHEEIIGPKSLTSLHSALREVGNPRRTLFAIHRTIGELLEQLDEMLGGIASGDEERNEGGEGLRFDHGSHEEALSGIKLYKGETLLELTERWRLLHRRLYDEDDDTFDLSRVPDVHDNVRFDMLHNPHLGLTGTLEKLYNLAKVMADCVVPQEYGTTIAEKRSVGVKMCGALLEKIKYDLIIARTDNEVDMRYMINMDYSADLAINTMGRRIRTRLYFTSESHLHTLMNVLRYYSRTAACGTRGPLLSQRGMDLSNKAPELCYLTQVVIRLFENPNQPLDDPRRFRVEILFSPGATATPLHMAEMDRDSDATRFETTKLQMISKDGLACKEVEDYFTEAINEGKTAEEDDDELVSVSAQTKKDKKKKKKKDKKKMDRGTDTGEKVADEEKKAEETKKIPGGETAGVITTVDEQGEERELAADAPPPAAVEPVAAVGGAPLDGSAAPVGQPDACLANVSAHAVDAADDTPKKSTLSSTVSEKEDRNREDAGQQTSHGLDLGGEPAGGGGTIGEPGTDTQAVTTTSRGDLEGGGEGEGEENASADDEKKLRKLEQVLARRYFWTSVAAVSFTVGMGCLAVAFGSRSRNGPSRRWTQR